MRGKVSIRVGTSVLFHEDRRREVLAVLKEYRDAVGEVAFFTSFTHAPLPLRVIEERAEKLAGLIVECKALGLSAGINHLATIGHHEENLENSLQEPWQRVMNIEGAISRGSLCMADPDVQVYIGKCYVALAQAEPDFIWIDDDVRFGGHMPVSNVCFCDRCLAIFGEETGRRWTRESLRAAFRSGPVEEQLALRKRWLEHNRKQIAGLFRRIRSAVDTVNSSLPIGFMTGEHYIEGYGYREWAAELSGPKHLPVRWRPGGGFYSDHVPTEVLEKAHDIGRQIARLPLDVTDIQSEIENFPYQRLKKSVAMTALECAVDIGAGCTGAALNIGTGGDDPFGEYRPFFEETRKSRSFLEREVATFGRSPCEGIWLAASNDHLAALALNDDWFSGKVSASLRAILELAEMGLPTAYAREGAAVTLLSGDGCLAFGREELRKMLAGGVLMDVAALIRLNELGLSEYTGFEVAAKREDDTQEVLAADAINGEFVGWHRDCRQSFKWWAETAYILKPLASGARVLSEGADYAGKKYGPLSGVYENGQGGRVAVCGYFPWTFLQNLAKSSQMKRLCRWLSKETLPAWVMSFAKVPLWCRRDAQGQLAMLVLNASLDAQEGLKVAVRGAAPEMDLVRTDGRTERVKDAGKDGEYSVLEISRVAPWEVALIVAR